MNSGVLEIQLRPPLPFATLFPTDGCPVGVRDNARDQEVEGRDCRGQRCGMSTNSGVFETQLGPPLPRFDAREAAANNATSEHPLPLELRSLNWWLATALAPRESPAAVPFPRARRMVINCGN